VVRPREFTIYELRITFFACFLFPDETPVATLRSTAPMVWNKMFLIPFEGLLKQATIFTGSEKGNWQK
jgi:hypothetical protein